MKRLLFMLLGAALMLALVAVATVLFLSGSERGTRLLAGQAERLFPITIEEISGTLWRELQVGRVELNLAAGRLEIQRLVLALRLTPLIFDDELHVLHARAETVVYRSAGSATGPDTPVGLELPRLPLSLRLDTVDVERLLIEDLAPIAVHGAAHWTASRLIVTALDVDYAGISASLSGRITDGPDPVLTADFRWSYPEMGLAGRGSLDGIASRVKISHQLEGEYRAETAGAVDLSRLDQPGYDLQVVVEPFALGDLRFATVHGTLQGNLDHVNASAESRLDTGVIPPFQVSVRLEGPPAGPVDLAVASDDLLSGRVAGAGRLGWADGINLVLAGQADRLNISGLTEQLTGEAGGRIDLSYRSQLLQVAVSDLVGVLNGYPVTGEFAAQQVPDGWRLAPVHLNVGGNHVAGSLLLEGETLSLLAALEAPALDELGLGVAGDVTAQVTASGRWPELDGSLAFTSKRLQGFEIVGAGLSGSATMAAGRLAATIVGEELQTRELEFRQIRAEVGGMLNDLNFQLGWGNGDFAGSVGGRYVSEGAERRLQASSLQVRMFEHDWTIEQPVLLVYGDNKLQVSPFCVIGSDARACVSEFDYTGKTLRTEGRLLRLPLRLAAPWLPVQLGEGGYLEANWRVQGAAGLWNGTVDMAARSLLLLPMDTEDEAVELPDVTVRGTLAGTDLALDIAATDVGFALTGSATVSPVDPAGVLAGRVTVTSSDLSLLQTLDGRIAELDGDLKGTVDLSGTLIEPRFEGFLKLVDAKLRVNDPDVVLDDLDADLTVDDSGEFRLLASGTNLGARVSLEALGSGLFDGQLAASARLHGNNLRAEHPDWEVAISPDLMLDYAQDKGRLHGRVEIPRARVRLNTLPQSIPRPSDDVVVVGRDQNGAGTVGPIEVDLIIVLGNDIKLSAAGIQASLTGQLNARLDKRGRASARGKLDVTGGSVSAQGQTLKLESGSIAYNGPLNNPYIDVRAVRVIDDQTPPIKVGLHISGTANNLTTAVFSEPPMSDARALSFLVLGRDLEEGDSGDSNQLLAAAINLGLSQAGSITSEIMRITGLDELSAMAEGQDSFSVVAGKRVTNDVYLRYTYDTLTAMSALLVRYSLTDRWHLEARSSQESSMDLMYTFEN